MKPLSRRSVTTGIAAAVTAIPAVGLCKSAKDNGELRSLIKAHRAAYRAFCKAIDREQAAKDAWEQLPDTVTVPCFLGNAYSLKYGREFCEKGLAAEYAKHRERLKPLSRVAPELADQVRAALDKTEADNTALLNRMLAEQEARKEAAGVAQAERNWESTEEAEHEAAIAVCAYRCRTLDEARIKAEYLVSAPGLRDIWDEHRGVAAIVHRRSSMMALWLRVCIFTANRLVDLAWALRHVCHSCALRLVAAAKRLVPGAERFLVQRTWRS